MSNSILFAIQNWYRVIYIISHYHVLDVSDKKYYQKKTVFCFWNIRKTKFNYKGSICEIYTRRWHMCIFRRANKLLEGNKQIIVCISLKKKNPIVCLCLSDILFESWSGCLRPIWQNKPCLVCNICVALWQLHSYLNSRQ